MSLDDRLRDEILESQRVQSQLAKWKLILIAGIVAAAIGAVPGGDRIDRLSALIFVPIACLYVDALSFHAAARLMTVAQYFRVRSGRRRVAAQLTDEMRMFDDYEEYCEEHRRHLWVEPFAMLLVSIFACAGVAVVGTSSEVARDMLQAQFHSDLTPSLLVWAGTLGVALTACSYAWFQYEIRRIRAEGTGERDRGLPMVAQPGPRVPIKDAVERPPASAPESPAQTTRVADPPAETL